VAERVPPPEEQVPPPGEPVHLPGPSYLPALVAAGISVALVGVVIYWALVVIGSLVTIVALVRWIRQVREEMAALPLDH
jgi:hypothetical protein